MRWRASLAIADVGVRPAPRLHYNVRTLQQKVQIITAAQWQLRQSAVINHRAQRSVRRVNGRGCLRHRDRLGLRPYSE